MDCCYAPCNVSVARSSVNISFVFLSTVMSTRFIVAGTAFAFGGSTLSQAPWIDEHSASTLGVEGVFSRVVRVGTASSARDSVVFPLSYKVNITIYNILISLSLQPVVSSLTVCKIIRLPAANCPCYPHNYRHKHIGISIRHIRFALSLPLHRHHESST